MTSVRKRQRFVRDRRVQDDLTARSNCSSPDEIASPRSILTTRRPRAFKARKSPRACASLRTLNEAQALGDFRALKARGRRVVRIDLGDAISSGLEQFERAVKSS